MGDPKKQSNKFQKPMHPWNKARLEQEKPLMQKYGLETKKELWKATSKLKTFKQNAKRLVALKGTQAELERTQMFEKLKAYGLVASGNLDDILGLQSEQILDRRLQTIVLKKGLARTIKQARQMITHRHVTVNGIKVTAPSYFVKIADEHTVSFYPSSKFFREDHPERPAKEQSLGKSSTNVENKEDKKEVKDTKNTKSKKPATKKKEETPTEVVKEEVVAVEEKTEEAQNE
jgi:small subunit ribosomal protein S4